MSESTRKSGFHIQPVTEGARDWMTALLVEQWGATQVVRQGSLMDASLLPGFLACADGDNVGLVTYQIADEQCEIVTLNSLVEGVGVGSALIAAVWQTAEASGCRRLWLITTNDNLNALRFYQKRGFCLTALRPNALEAARRLKPQIPLVGEFGIPLRDEIELEAFLSPKP